MIPTPTFTPEQIARARFTEDEIRSAIRKAGSVKDAADLLGVSRKTVHEYINGYGIPIQRGVVITDGA